MTIAVVPPSVVTRTSTTPAVPAGETAVICVALFTVKLVALEDPNVTEFTFVKLVPVITTDVPPVVRPTVVPRLEIDGTGKYVN